MNDGRGEKDIELRIPRRDALLNEARKNGISFEIINSIPRPQALTSTAQIAPETIGPQSRLLVI